MAPTFEVLGSPGEEARLVVDPARGFSVVVPGRPEAVTLTAGDLVVDLALSCRDIAMMTTFRIDEAGADSTASGLAEAIAVAHAANRIEGHRPARQVPDSLTRGFSADAAWTVIYEVAPDQMERVLVIARRRDSGNQVLTLTNRWRKPAVDAIVWTSFRTALGSTLSWTCRLPEEAPAPWPRDSPFWRSDSPFTLRHERTLAQSRLTEDYRRFTGFHLDASNRYVRELALGDEPPPQLLTERQLERIRASLPLVASAGLVELLLQGFDDVESVHDLRGWAAMHLRACSASRVPREPE